MSNESVAIDQNHDVMSNDMSYQKLLYYCIESPAIPIVTKTCAILGSTLTHLTHLTLWKAHERAS